MKKIIAIFVFGIFFSTEVWAQTLIARANRTEVPEGETFLLTLDYDGQDNGVPDLNVLDKDFTIYSVSNSFSTNYINGTTIQKRQWQVGLMPKVTGGNEVSIPSIKLGNIQSNPVQIKVLNASSVVHPNNSSNSDYQAPSNKPRFAIKGEVDTNNPFVQQQVNYTLTLFDTGGLQGSEPEFVDNGKNDWMIKNLGAPTIDRKVINGQSIGEIKFHYALFPQKSGILQTPEIRFNGYYLTQSGRGSDPFEEIFGGGLTDVGFGNMFATRNPVVLTTKPVDIEVKPIPAVNNGNWWLPAENVKLYAEWNPSKPTFKVGEAVNRTIYLKATGVVENQLPDIKFNSVAGLKQYPEKAVSQNSIEQDKVVAVKKIANVYIPNTAGKMTIPEVSVEWFNVKSNQMEKSVLPAVTIQVQPNATLSETAEPILPAVAPTSSLEQRGQTIEKVAEESKDILKNELPSLSDYRVFYMAIAAFVLGLLFSFLIFRSPRSKRNSTKPHQDVNECRKCVIKNAKAKDFRALRDSLLDWAEEKFKDEKITNMKDVVKHVGSKDFEKQIEILTAELYGNSQTEWDGDDFIKAFEKADDKKVVPQNETKPLPGLYK